mmetsp:Transcript_11341/g.12166  ORF Transcript_11341/g.12166 Transcript_11341/m.12166 type:complete len:198 (+) Transcript_11341:65-658(+)
MTNTPDNTNTSSSNNNNNNMKRMSKSTTRKMQGRRTRRSTIPMASFSSLSSTMTTLLVLFYFSTIITVVVHGLGDKVSNLPLYEDTPTHCDDMLDLHKWEGSCCSLNVTEGNGCVLNVRDGNCYVRGQIWSLNYTSTSDIPCPPSEYSPEMLGMKPAFVPTEPGAESSSPGRGGANIMGIMRAVSVIGVIIGTIFLL